MTPADFRIRFDVSRETAERLEAYEALLGKWTARINLIGRSTVDTIWERHFADSAQLLALAPPTARTWLDLGSGAGLPGLVVAILAAEKKPDLAVTLVESDMRKCAFLSAAARETAAAVRVIPARIEQLPAEPADVVSARALAPLGRLLELAEPFRGPGTVCLFPKGRGGHSELTAARERWMIDAEAHPSIADAAGLIFVVRNFERRT